MDHYLEILLRKPGALPGATALVKARAARVFTPTHDAFWAAARKALGDSASGRRRQSRAYRRREHRIDPAFEGLNNAAAGGR